MLGNCRGALGVISGSALRSALPHSGVFQGGTSGLQLQLLRAAPSAPGIYLTISRHMASLKLNRNMEFFSVDDIPLPKVKGSLCVSPAKDASPERPLTILMCWLMSKDSHTKKFVNFYNDLGIDVLKIRVSPFDLLRPVKGTQVVAGSILEFLHQNPRHSSVLVHGFSVGCYTFCEGMVQVANNMKRHGPLMDRFVGQIWDSPVDIQGIPSGTAKAITNNKILQASIQKYLEWFLRTQHEMATVHYMRASKMMHDGFLSAPGLFLLSKVDPIATPQMVASVYEKWEDRNIPVFVKVFEKSSHVSHYVKHKKEYVEEVLTFLQRVDLVQGQGSKRRVSA